MAIAACLGCVAAAADAETGPPALKPASGSAAFPVSLTLTGGSSKFYITGAETTCTGETGTGEFTSGKHGNLAIKLTGCQLAGKQCGNVAEGEIELKPLTALLAYTYPAKSGSEGRETGLVLSPASGEVFAEYSCTFLKLKVAVKGSLIAKVSPLDTSTNALTLTIARNESHEQALSEYESEVGEVITARLKGAVGNGSFKTIALEGPSTTIALKQAATVAARPYRAPTAVTSPVFGASGSSGYVAGEVSPEGLETTYHFEYGTTTSYGSSTPEASAGEGMTPLSKWTEISGLTAGETYHYRIVAANSDGTSYGEDMTFTVRTYTVPLLQTSPWFYYGAYTVTGGSSKWNLSGAEVHCTGATGSGEFRNAKEGTLTIKLTGCTLGGKQCGNVAEGEIELKPLRSALEYTYPAKSGSEGRETGLVLYALSGELLAEYSCTFLGLHVAWRGSTIAGVSPLGKWTRTLSLAITQKEGVQGIGSYEAELGGAVAARLEGRINTGAFHTMTTEATSWSIGMTGEGSEALIEV